MSLEVHMNILRKVFTAVSSWRMTGRRLRLKARTLDVYASSFEHSLMDEARRLVGRAHNGVPRPYLKWTLVILALHSLAVVAAAGRGWGSIGRRVRPTSAGCCGGILAARNTA